MFMMTGLNADDYMAPFHVDNPKRYPVQDFKQMAAISFSEEFDDFHYD